MRFNSIGAVALVAGAAVAPLQATTLQQVQAHIQHVIVIMQENRSFDHYFGMFPGADGLPAGVCEPFDPTTPQKGCVAPYHSQDDYTTGGPHGSQNAQADLDDGITTTKQDGFVQQAESVHTRNCKSNPYGKYCPGLDPQPDAMGYYLDSEIPNYWAYAENFVLQDRLFEGVRAYSLDSHVDLTSQWTAVCSNEQDQTTCSTVQTMPRAVAGTTYPWANMMQLLDANNVSWKYYLGSGLEPDCADGQDTCDPEPQLPTVGSLWNPIPQYKTVKQQGSAYLAAHNPDMNQLLVDLQNGTLPQVAYVVPNSTVSEHPHDGPSAGQDYVTSMVNAVMQSQYWQNTVIFISWDDWGGFYDHVVPPNAWIIAGSATPVEGFGLRVPGLMISAWVNPGAIDHQTMSFESYATFIEDLFTNGARLNPTQLGLPDSRPVMPDSITSVSFPDGHSEQIGDFVNDFNFSQAPLQPLVLSTHIPNKVAATCDKPKLTTCTDDVIDISWQSLTGPNIATVFTYHVLQDGVELTACATQGTTCKITASSGDHFYRVYSVDPGGVISPNSAAAEQASP